MVMSALKTSNMPWTLDKSKRNYGVLLVCNFCGDQNRWWCKEMSDSTLAMVSYCIPSIKLFIWPSDAHDCLRLRLLEVAVMLISHLLPCGPSPELGCCWHCRWGRPQPFLFTCCPQLPPASQAGRLPSFLVLDTHPEAPRPSAGPSPRGEGVSPATSAGFLRAFSVGWSNNSTCTYWVLTVFQALSKALGKKRLQTSLRRGTMGFPRQGYWNGLPFSSPGDLPNSGIELGSSTLQADSLPSEPRGNR